MYATQVYSGYGNSQTGTDAPGAGEAAGGYLGVHRPAVRANGLSAEDACRQLDGFPHTIAQMVSHLHFWQQRRLRLVRGEEKPRDMSIELGKTDFEPVEPGDWARLRAAFLDSYAELLACADDRELILSQTFDDANAGFVLTSHCLHNAYHLGQIVLMRKVMGNWVPVHPS